jgi:hypothetical protein
MGIKAPWTERATGLASFPAALTDAQRERTRP